MSNIFYLLFIIYYLSLNPCGAAFGKRFHLIKADHRCIAGRGG